VTGGSGVGRTQRMWGYARGKATEIDSTVTSYEAPRLLRWHHDAERVDGKPGPVVYARDAVAEVLIEPDAGGCTVTYRLLADPGNLLYWFMLTVLAPGPIRKSFDTSLERLAGLAQGSGR
jgi:hypothetical protein